MTDVISSDPKDAAAAVAWTAAMEAATEEEGYFHRIGKEHWAFFADQGTTLLVSFETVADIAARSGNLPFAQDIAAKNGWSHLCLIADGATWFRDRAVYAFFDRQIDDAFFEDFDRVLFYGAGMGGYAACAYSVSAPGAQVLALSPRATLCPAEAGWDHRDLAARRLDFTSRFGYAPDMLEGAAGAVVVHDTTILQERMHAALFRDRHVTRLAAPHAGADLQAALMQMAILPEMITAAMAGRLDAAGFSRLWRARRDHAGYLNALLAKAAQSSGPAREVMILRSATARLALPKFEKRLARLTGKREASAPETATPSA